MIDSNHHLRRIGIAGLALVWLFAIGTAPAESQDCSSLGDGTVCDAGSGDEGRCMNGVCVGVPLSCTSLPVGAVCDAGVCEGRCLANGTCVSLADLTPCAAQVCRSATFNCGTLACEYSPLLDGTPCSTGEGVCQGGVCVDGGTVCRDDEFYLDGVCIPVSAVCVALTCRTAVSYDPATAVCQYASQPDGTACSSSIGQSVCEGGLCVEPSVLGIGKLRIKLHFAAPASRDTILLKATLAVPDGFTAAGAQLFIDVGGVVKSFDLDAAGKAKVDTDRVKLTVASTRGVVLAQDAKLSVQFANGSFASWLADDGLTDTTVSELPISIPVRVVMNGHVYATTQPQTYTAKVGKTGKTK